MNQIELYKSIDDFLAKGPLNAKKEIAQSFIDANLDRSDYFFAQTPIEWINWLNENGFFEILNKEDRDNTQHSSRLPELGYLARVIESKGDEEKVVDIMKAVDCSANFSPEVVDQFLWIAQKLSVQNLVKIIPKIQKENWIYLMKDIQDSGFSYEPIVKKLMEAKKYKELLIIAKAMLTVNKDKAIDDFSNKYFYLSNIHETGLFEALRELKDQYTEMGIELISGILPDLVVLKDTTKAALFKYDDKFYIGDLDFFSLRFKDHSRLNMREDVKDLLQTYATLIQSAIGATYEKDARRIYDADISNLPDSPTLWRLKLFTLSLCPRTFTKEIKKELNRIFTDYKKYSLLLSGTEYLKTLKKVFASWDAETEQRKYVRQILEKFGKLILEFPNEYWHNNYGFEILSTIASSLTSTENQQAVKLFGKALNESFQPEPPISEIRGGMIQDRSPVDFSEAKYKDILVIIQDLQNELSPGIIREKYKETDFLNPINAEGVGNAIKKDMKKRISEYLAHASDFLNANMHTHYTYSFLYGIEEYLRDKMKLSKDDWDNLFILFDKIKESNRIDSVQSTEEDGRWLAKWEWVLKTMAELLKLFISPEYKDLFGQKRERVLEIITFLLNTEDPDSSNQDFATNDLYTTAINTTKGIAFEALVNFVYQDGETLEYKVAQLYDNLIDDSPLFLRFLIGKYLATFYYRDKANVKGYFERIFPRKQENKEEFFAAWEGYLSNSLYIELFEDLEEYYLYALSIKFSEYPDRKGFRDVDQGIGAHLALAFGHFDSVSYTEKKKHKLLASLWESGDINKQKAFISFLGNAIISHEKAGKKWFTEQKIDLQKLRDFWTLILKTTDLDSDVYAAFGFWVNHKKDIFGDYAWLAAMMADTLEKSKGKLDWDYGLTATLPKLAAANPEKTLIIIEKYLLDGVLGEGEKKWFYLDDAKISAFEILYKAKPTETTSLINKLLEKGGRLFWPLRNIVK